MSRRRTGGIQRRSRASQDALNRPLDQRRTSVPWPLVGIGALLVVGVIAVVVALVAQSGPNPDVGVAQPDDGRGHLPECTPQYSSTPPTSGCHFGTPGNWGVYASPADPTQLVHNLEHGGIVIWYQPDQLSAEQVDELESYVETQVRSTQYKVIVSPWTGEDFEHPIAVTAWGWLLYLDEVQIDRIRSFLDAHYGDAPEPLGGPGPPAG